MREEGGESREERKGWTQALYYVCCTQNFMGT